MIDIFILFSALGIIILMVILIWFYTGKQERKIDEYHLMIKRAKK